MCLPLYWSCHGNFSNVPVYGALLRRCIVFFFFVFFINGSDLSAKFVLSWNQNGDQTSIRKKIMVTNKGRKIQNTIKSFSDIILPFVLTDVLLLPPCRASSPHWSQPCQCLKINWPAGTRASTWTLFQPSRAVHSPSRPTQRNCPRLRRFWTRPAHSSLPRYSTVSGRRSRSPLRSRYTGK